MEKQPISENEKRALKKGSSDIPPKNSQTFPLEITTLLDVLARIELRRQREGRIIKEVS